MQQENEARRPLGLWEGPPTCLRAAHWLAGRLAQVALVLEDDSGSDT